MLKKVINPILFLPLALSINSVNVLSSETKDYIDNVLKEKSNITFVDYQEIEKLVLKNQELKSLQNLVTSASFNLSSQIAKRYPSIDFQANGLPSIYWGQDQVVTGLLTGEDLIYGLRNKDLGEAIYIPSIMLKINTDLFLYDKNIQEVENQLNTKIHVLDDSNDIINTLIG